jgi:hypothetical protein
VPQNDRNIVRPLNASLGTAMSSGPVGSPANHGVIGCAGCEPRTGSDRLLTLRKARSGEAR